MDKQRRLKQKDLVARLFALFAEEAEKENAESLFDIDLPLATIRGILKDRTGVEYTSDSWISTQIRKYEEEIGVTLFRRSGDLRIGARLGIERDIRTYFQKKHLYTSQKIMTANGMLDLIRHVGPQAGDKTCVTALLGGGSTVTKVAEFIAEAMASEDFGWRIATHNLGVIQILGAIPGGIGPEGKSAEILVPQGRVDPATYLILGKNIELYRTLDFQWIVQGTSYVKNGNLYVENPEESAVNRAILKECSGLKALLLTGHEAECPVPEEIPAFGSVGEYDYIVFPSDPRPTPARARLVGELEKTTATLGTWIKSWSYEIIKVEKSACPVA